MRSFTNRARVVAASVAIVVAGGAGVAAAASTAAPASNAMQKGMGINEFGMTKSFFNGGTVSFTYSKGYYCDKSVTSAASSGCEAGATYKVPPASSFDPLYITVPLGFTVPMASMECPAALVCVDHPGTIDLSRLEPDLKALYPTMTAAQLTAALKNSATPGHEHFITTQDGGKAEWWDVKVIGVTSLAEWNAINAHKSFTYLNQQVNAKKTTPIIPTNLFLYFSVN
ncbi:MAG TPA: hypothetical protein VG246_11120 [Acidimicrobiales bacterium]|nr:hypothetical protein [Acidimicrobiales bacterium]